MPEILKIITHAQLEHAMKRSYSQPVVILVTTTGCYPCCYAESTIKSRAERSPHAYYAIIGSDTFPDVAKKYKIEYYPAYLLFRNGELKNSAFGINLEKVDAFFNSF
uniref:Thioredoxin-related protein n=1 Tax=Taenia solium TaxID=6204 RepID=A0A0N9DXH2_TAESO|nr:thioredoxin-related protein [Taenia solium]